VSRLLFSSFESSAAAKVPPNGVRVTSLLRCATVKDRSVSVQFVVVKDG